MAVALISTFVPLTELAELVNIGTLFAFVLVAIGVLVLRRTRPDLERAFRCPGVPVVPILAALAAVYLMLNLPAATWLRFFIWMAIGLVVYFGYSARKQPPGHRPELLARRRRREPREAQRLTDRCTRRPRVTPGTRGFPRRRPSSTPPRGALRTPGAG